MGTPEHRHTPVVDARGLVKRYAGKRVVDGVDLQVWPGECFGLLGPNGAGKSGWRKKDTVREKYRCAACQCSQSIT